MKKGSAKTSVLKKFSKESLTPEKVAEYMFTYYRNLYNEYEEKRSKIHDLDVLRYLIPEILNLRETAFLTKIKDVKYREIRNIRITKKEDFFYRITDFYLKKKIPYNLYASLGSYQNGMPILWSSTMNKPYTADWKINHYQQMISYDWLIDIDSPSYTLIDEIKEDVIKICHDLDKKNIKNYTIRFTGCGFHIVIPYIWINGFDKFHFNPNEKGNIYEYLTNLTKRYHVEISECVDYQLNDSRRIVKVPGSLVYNPEKSNHVYKCVLMHSIDELKKFSWKEDALVPDIEVLENGG